MMTDNQLFQRLTAQVESGEISTADAHLIGERNGIDFSDFADQCDCCGSTGSQWWRETKTQLLCSKCA